jgi:hypothetical protein
VRFDSLTASSPEHDLLLKVQGTTWTAGAIQVVYSAAQAQVVVNTYAPGTGWSRSAGPWKATLMPGDQLGARATADGMLRVFRNGQKVGEVSLASWPFASKGGRVGMLLNRANTSRMTSFGGGGVRPDSGMAQAAGALAVGTESGAAGDQILSGDVEVVEEAESVALPTILMLSNAFPNPSRGPIALAIELPEAADVSFQVFDVQGRLAWQAPHHRWNAGRWRLDWSGRDDAGRRAPAGIYLARVTIGGRSFTRRVTLTP